MKKIIDDRILSQAIKMHADGYSYAYIANKFDLNKNTLISAINRCRKKFDVNAPEEMRSVVIPYRKDTLQEFTNVIGVEWHEKRAREFTDKIFDKLESAFNSGDIQYMIASTGIVKVMSEALKNVGDFRKANQESDFQHTVNIQAKRRIEDMNE